MDEMLDNLLENTKFTNKSIEICFLPQKIGLGYKYTPPKNLELKKSIKKKKRIYLKKEDSEEENMESMIRKKHK